MELVNALKDSMDHLVNLLIVQKVALLMEFVIVKQEVVHVCQILLE